MVYSPTTCTEYEDRWLVMKTHTTSPSPLFWLRFVISWILQTDSFPAYCPRRSHSISRQVLISEFEARRSLPSSYPGSPILGKAIKFYTLTMSFWLKIQTKKKLILSRDTLLALEKHIYSQHGAGGGLSCVFKIENLESHISWRFSGYHLLNQTKQIEQIATQSKKYLGLGNNCWPWSSHIHQVQCRKLK